MAEPKIKHKMKTLRRYHLQNRQYFVTVVTHNRNRFLLDDLSLFWSCWMTIPLVAWVILPDHFHTIIDVESANISDIMRNFKLRYALRWRKNDAVGKCWQNRFWDHIIRDQNDLNLHLDYIHYNPVKHGLVTNPFDYPHSSLMNFCGKGLYEPNWGIKENMKFGGDYGE
ncbi:conserved hypothetical protein [Candidatus Zixiibacteriota bacterium]|nr:conserved hypothetical protein [candidate division Zixibacteria bacterium]